MKELKDILSIAGKPGLHRLITTSRASIIVESMENGKRLPVAATAKISSLEDISIFTYEEDVPLKEVFAKMLEVTQGKEAPNSKKASHQDLRNFMGDVLPNFDEDRVYHSDLKKLMQWFNFLLNANFFNEDETSNLAVEEAIIIEETEDQASASDDKSSKA
jgi:hypothetical protein